MFDILNANRNVPLIRYLQPIKLEKCYVKRNSTQKPMCVHWLFMYFFGCTLMRLFVFNFMIFEVIRDKADMIINNWIIQ